MSSPRQRPDHDAVVMKVVPTTDGEQVEESAGSRPATSEVIAEALPDLIALDASQRRRLQEALIACRAGAGASRDRLLRAAFALHREDLMTRGELREMFDLDLWTFLEHEQRYGREQRETIEF